MVEGLPMGAASLKDWVLNRLGANPPKALVDMRDWGTLAVLAACGIPLELFSSTQGTAALPGLLVSDS